MNGCQSRSVLFHKKSNRKNGKWKWIHKPDIWPPCSVQKNRRDICKTFFSDFGCNFLLLEGVFHKCSKSKYHSIQQYNFFGTHFVCEKHPLHVFFLFPPLCIQRFVKTFSSSNFWRVKKAPWKEFHVFGQNWQRNHFPKLTTFLFILHPMLQLSHSAMSESVTVEQCLHVE